MNAHFILYLHYLQLGIGDHCEVPEASGVAPAGSGVKALNKKRSAAKSGAKSVAKKRATIEETTSDEESFSPRERDTFNISGLSVRSRNQLDFSSSSSSPSPNIARTSTPILSENVFHPSVDIPFMDKSKSTMSCKFKLKNSISHTCLYT